jgi:hypothetical protein
VPVLRLLTLDLEEPGIDRTPFVDRCQVSFILERGEMRREKRRRSSPFAAKRASASQLITRSRCLPVRADLPSSARRS